MAIRSNVAANFASQGVATLIGVAFIPLYLQFLGMEAYGLVGVFMLVLTWLGLLDLGLTPALAREMAKFTAGAHDPRSIRRLLRSVEIGVFGIAMLVAVGLWVASSWLAENWLRADDLPLHVVATAFALMGIVVALRLIENMYRSSLLGLQRQVSVSFATIVLATVRAAGAVAVLAWVSPTPTAFFGWQAFISAVSAVGYGVMLYRSLPAARGPAEFSLRPLRSVRRFAGGTLLIAMLGLVLSQSDKLVLSATVTLSAFAVYSIAYTVAGTVRLLARPIDQAVFPRLIQLHEEGKHLALSDLYHSATQYNVVITGSLACVLAVFGGEVLLVWTGDMGLAAQVYPVLRLLAIGMLLNGLVNGPSYLQMAAGWTGLLVRVNLVMTAVFVPVVYVLVAAYGLIGAAASWVAINVAYLATVTGLTHRRLLPGEATEWYLRDVAIPISAGLLAALALRPFAPTGEPILLAGYLIGAWACVFLSSGLAAARVRSAVMAQLRVQFGACQ